jgi:F-type H+-transporting ATPase subunit b
VIHASPVLGASSGTNLILPATNELIWGTVAFVLLLLLLWRVGVFGRMRQALAERSARIQGDLERAEEARRQAEEVLARYRQQLADARQEANRIVEEARQSAEQVRRDMVARAEADANRIVVRAQEEIQGERNRAIAEVRTETATLALELAGRVIGETLDDERHRRLVERYIEELAPSGQG